MRYLKTNTAVIITVGPFYDKTDGVTIETALTITNERITMTADTDDGSAPTNVLDNVTGATSGTSNDLNYITGNDAGMMQLELSAANTNRLGRMFLSITDAVNHVPVFHEFMVLPAVIYDSLILGTDLLQADVTQLLGTAWLTPGTAGTPDVNVKLISDDSTAANNAEAFFDGTGYAGTNNVIPLVTTTTAVTTVNGLAANIITAAATAADFTTEIQTGLATAAALATVQADTDNIQTRLPAALASGRMDSNASRFDNVDPASYLAVALAPYFSLIARGDSAVGNDLPVELDTLNTDYGGGAGTYNPATDGLEALRNNTGTSGAGLTAADDATLAAIAALNNLSQANVRTAVGLATANLDTQLDALPTNAELATALGTADDAVLAAIAALNNPTTAAIASAVAALVIETGYSLTQTLQLIAAATAGKLSGAATTTNTIRDLADTADRITATVDADGNRTAITYNV